MQWVRRGVSFSVKPETKYAFTAERNGLGTGGRPWWTGSQALKENRETRLTISNMKKLEKIQ